MQVSTVVLPGRETARAQQPLTDFATAVERLCCELLPITDKPYALFGHSLGALLALEVGCRLEHRGQRPPSCLIVSGRAAPHLPGDDAEESNGGPTSTLPDAELVAVLRSMDGTPPELLDNPEMMQFLLPLIRADFRLAESYRWESRSRISCPVLAIGGRADSSAAPDKLNEWCAMTTAGVTVHAFDGGHFFITGCEAEVCCVIGAFLDQHMREG